MSDKLRSYVVIKETSLKELEIRVNEHHDDGFELAGPLQIVRRPPDQESYESFVYFQPMIAIES